MFKRRSSKDLSAKIGYDHVNGKASRSSSSSITTSSAPVANVPHSHRKHPSFSSSYRKTTGMPSPEGDSGGATDTSNSTGPSPLGGIKSLPPGGQTLEPEERGQQQQPQLQQPQRDQQQREQQGNGVTAIKPSGKSKSSSAAPKVVAEPPSKSLVIGEGVLFEGATEGCSAAVVGGRLVGTVKSRRLEITRAGRMEGTATVETAEIAGTFEGSLTVTKALKVRDMRKLLWLFVFDGGKKGVTKIPWSAQLTSGLTEIHRDRPTKGALVFSCRRSLACTEAANRARLREVLSRRLNFEKVVSRHHLSPFWMCH